VTEDEHTVRQQSKPSVKVSKGKNAEGVYEKHVIYRTRNIRSGATLQNDASTSSSALIHDDIVESTEELADLIDDATQTEQPRVEQSIQTEVQDDPPSYAEHLQKDIALRRSHAIGQHIQLWTQRIPYAEAVWPRISPFCQTAMETACENPSSFILYSTVCLLLGIVGGFTISSRLHPSLTHDRQLWLAYNSLHDSFTVYSTSRWSYWFHEFLYGSLDVARRVPT